MTTRISKEPPTQLIGDCKSQWDVLRADATRNNVTELAESMVVESVLCGRIWSDTNKFAHVTLTKNTGSLQSHLRACLAFHQIERLENYDWKNFGPFLRNEMISNRIATEERTVRQEVSKFEEETGREPTAEERAEIRTRAKPQDTLKDNLLKDWGVTEEEKNTLKELNIDLPEHITTNDVKVEPDTNEEFWEPRDLFHVSLDHIQAIIKENTKTAEGVLSKGDATQYYSLTISRLFEDAVLSMVEDPGPLLSETREGIGLLHLVEEHALISATTPLGERPMQRVSSEADEWQLHAEKVCKKIIDLLGERLSSLAEGKGMDLNELRLKCSVATETYTDAKKIPFEILEGGTETTETQNLLDGFQELQSQENQITDGWGGHMSRTQDRGPKAIYIDAVKLTNQIWGEIGDRKSIKAFLRSIRITPHMNFVFGKAITSVRNSRKIIHGGDDFMLTYTEHAINKEDLVPLLMGDVLKPLIGIGRWQVKKTDEGDDTYHVIGTGFATPFWWWYDGPSYGESREGALLDALKKAKEPRRSWLRYATRTDIQIHPNMDGDEEE